MKLGTRVRRTDEYLDNMSGRWGEDREEWSAEGEVLDEAGHRVLVRWDDWPDPYWINSRLIEEVS